MRVAPPAISRTRPLISNGLRILFNTLISFSQFNPCVETRLAHGPDPGSISVRLFGHAAHVVHELPYFLLVEALLLVGGHLVAAFPCLVEQGAVRLLLEGSGAEVARIGFQLGGFRAVTQAFLAMATLAMRTPQGSGGRLVILDRVLLCLVGIRNRPRSVLVGKH